MTLRWTSAARNDRRSIYAYIEGDSESAAAAVDLRIWNAAMSLLDIPGKGRIGKVPGTREWVVIGTSYILAYRVESDAIRILRVMHGAQRWPKKMPQL